jgi:2-polyprenyl-3-methyl-5-hydroxy-6-metoxy-1,4-benzoquinol methylase
MDDPALDPAVHAEALRSLARLNAVSGGSRGLWKAIRNLSNDTNKVNLRVLDIACGGGDLLFQLAQKADQSGLNLDIVGADISDTAITLASRKVSAADFSMDEYRVDEYREYRSCSSVRFMRMNALEDRLPPGFDVIMTSLFTHHLDAPQVVALLQKMYNSAKHLVLVNDLERSRLNWSMVWMATRLLSRSYVVHFDGPVSVRAAYTAAEFSELARQAGITDCNISRLFPCRFLFAARK